MSPPTSCVILATVIATFADAAAQTRPQPPVLCQNCWPSECGQGAWTATGQVAVHAAPADTSAVAFAAVPGDTLLADSSLVRVTQFGLVVLQRAYEPYALGDSVLLTQALGEGSYSTWSRRGGGVRRPFWGPGVDAPARLVRPVLQEWWMHVQRGRAGGAGGGWVLMTESTLARHTDCP